MSTQTTLDHEIVRGLSLQKGEEALTVHEWLQVDELAKWFFVELAKQTPPSRQYDDRLAAEAYAKAMSWLRLHRFFSAVHPALGDGDPRVMEEHAEGPTAPTA